MNIYSIFDCIICFTRYNDSNRKPNLLIPCGHTFCEKCLKSIKTCPTCRTAIERTGINYALIPSDQPGRPSASEKHDDSLWISLKNYMINDIEERKNILLKVKEETTNENIKIFSSLRSQIQTEANEKYEHIFIETERLMRKCDEKEIEIKSEIENIFLKNQDNIETELKLIKDKVENRQFELNEIENYKNKSDHLKNELDKKSNEIRNIKINIKLDEIMSQKKKSGI